MNQWNKTYNVQKQTHVNIEMWYIERRTFLISKKSIH